MVTKLEPQVKGLVLALDPRQVPTLHVVRGQNFLINASKIYSAFGSQYLTYEKIHNVQDLADFYLEEIDDSRIFTTQGVLGYNAASRSYYSVMVFSKEATEFFPWSWAYVGGSYYFGKKGMPVIKYNPITDEWLELDDTNSPGIVPNPYAVTDSFGRLVIADEDVVQWSAIDNGQVFENPDLGAGSQSLALVGGGKPRAVFHTQTGFVTYTSTGIMRSLFREADIPFTHRVGSEHITLLSPYAIAEIRRGIHVFLDISGLYQYNGEQGLPQEWQPLMSEFLRTTVLREFNIEGGEVPKIKFHYDSFQQLFHISLPTASNPDFYDRAYSAYLPKDEWGSFDKVHVTLENLFIKDSKDPAFNSGFFDQNGIFHIFTGQPKVENEDNPYEYTFFQEYFQAPVRVQNDVQIAGERVDAVAYDKFAYVSTGLYNSDMELVYPTMGALDSNIEVGLLRLLDPEFADRYTLLSDVIMGVEGLTLIVEDYMLVDPDVFEDWNILEGEEDWGLNVVPNAGFKAEAIGSLDGKIALEDQTVGLALLEESENRRHYTGDSNGIYHILKLSAVEEDQQFQLKTVEPVLKPTGRT